MKCVDCGSDIDTGGDNLRCSSCRIKQFNIPIGISGWICPICGAGLSPNTSRCPCRPMPSIPITC